LLQSFMENFNDEASQVQLQILSAVVKLFLKRPEKTQQMMQSVLNLSTTNIDNPDLRDRGYVYWRLLDQNPDAARESLLSERPPILDDTNNFSPQLLSVLVNNIATLASVFQRPPELFIRKNKEAVQKVSIPSKLGDAAMETSIPTNGGIESGSKAKSASEKEIPKIQSKTQNQEVSLIDIDNDNDSPVVRSSFGHPSTSSDNTGTPSLTEDLFALQISNISVPKTVLLTDKLAKGLQLNGGFVRRQGTIFLDLEFTNHTITVLNTFAIQFNKNSFGFIPAQSLQDRLQNLMSGQSTVISLPVAASGAVNPGPPVFSIQMAVKNNAGIFYFAVDVPLHVLFVEEKLLREEYLQIWKSIADANERSQTITPLVDTNLDVIQRKLEGFNVFFIAKRKVGNQDILYHSVKLGNGTTILVEFTFKGANECQLSCKAQNTDVLPYFIQSMVSILTQA